MFIPSDGRMSRTWRPLGAHPERKTPPVGSFVAYQHAAWRIVEISDAPVGEWTDSDFSGHTESQTFKKPYQGWKPQIVVLRPAHITADDPRSRDHDLHLRTTTPLVTWYVYPNGHYPVCAHCGEPVPCRAQLNDEIAAEQMTRMSRYETSSICPACNEPVTKRQASITFEENLVVPLGPPVTFHRKSKCIGSAINYEKHWVAAGDRRKPTLFCPGHLTNHNDGTYDCTEFDICPGSAVQHQGGYAMCRCPDCWARPWTWGKGCHPAPNARLNTPQEDRPRRSAG